MTPGNTIPSDIPQDVQGAATAQQQAFNEFESRLAELEGRLATNDLSQEAKLRALLIAEIEQRISVRKFSVRLAFVIIIFMAFLLVHAVHKYFWIKMVILPQSITLAMFIAPIISITTLAVLLIIGAFRRFTDDDMPKVNVASLASEVVNKSM